MPLVAGVLGGMSSLQEKCDLLRQQLNLKAGLSIADVIAQANTELGVSAFGKSLVVQADECLHALGVAPDPPLMGQVVIAMPVMQTVQPVMQTVQPVISPVGCTVPWVAPSTISPVGPNQPTVQPAVVVAHAQPVVVQQPSPGAVTHTAPQPMQMARAKRRNNGLHSAHALAGCWVGVSLFLPWAGSLRAVSEDEYVRDFQCCVPILPLCGRTYRRTPGTNTFRWQWWDENCMRATPIPNPRQPRLVRATPIPNVSYSAAPASTATGRQCKRATRTGSTSTARDAPAWRLASRPAA